MKREDAALLPGNVWRDAIPGLPESACPEMVTMPPGRFRMGAPVGEKGSKDDERPQHDVQIGYAFALGKYAVTVNEFAAFVAETSYDTGASAYVWNDLNEWLDTPGKGWRDPGFAQAGSHPVCCVNWRDAKAYVAWLNRKLGSEDRAETYRLPSEAEWEYACRAGTETSFSFGTTISMTQANYGNFLHASDSKGEWRQKTTPVGSFPANPFGLHDMHGNVREWCEDMWHANYVGAPSDGSVWIGGGGSSFPILRGGAWRSDPDSLRSAHRAHNESTLRSNGIGFRLARNLSGA